MWAHLWQDLVGDSVTLGSIVVGLSAIITSKIGARAGTQQFQVTNHCSPSPALQVWNSGAFDRRGWCQYQGRPIESPRALKKAGKSKDGTEPPGPGSLIPQPPWAKGSGMCCWLKGWANAPGIWLVVAVSWGSCGSCNAIHLIPVELHDTVHQPCCPGLALQPQSDSRKSLQAVRSCTYYTWPWPSRQMQSQTESQQMLGWVGRMKSAGNTGDQLSRRRPALVPRHHSAPFAPPHWLAAHPSQCNGGQVLWAQLPRRGWVTCWQENTFRLVPIEGHKVHQARKMHLLRGIIWLHRPLSGIQLLLSTGLVSLCQVLEGQFYQSKPTYSAIYLRIFRPISAYFRLCPLYISPYLLMLYIDPEGLASGTDSGAVSAVTMVRLLIAPTAWEPWILSWPSNASGVSSLI